MAGNNLPEFRASSPYDLVSRAALLATSAERLACHLERCRVVVERSTAATAHLTQGGDGLTGRQHVTLPIREPGACRT